MDFASLNNKKNVFHIFLRGNVNLWVRDTHSIKSTNKKSPINSGDKVLDVLVHKIFTNHWYIVISSC